MRKKEKTLISIESRALRSLPMFRTTKFPLLWSSAIRQQNSKLKKRLFCFLSVFKAEGKAIACLPLYTNFNLLPGNHICILMIVSRIVRHEESRKTLTKPCASQSTRRTPFSLCTIWLRCCHKKKLGWEDEINSFYSAFVYLEQDAFRLLSKFRLSTNFLRCHFFSFLLSFFDVWPIVLYIIYYCNSCMIYYFCNIAVSPISALLLTIRLFFLFFFFFLIETFGSKHFSDYHSNHYEAQFENFELVRSALRLEYHNFRCCWSIQWSITFSDLCFLWARTDNMDVIFWLLPP